ncbi:MAG: cytochrome c oxidase cbb3-type subunit [Bryobacterales bacterium]|nr:cytochrome c oxidase cbb3-type subunit [Bryobacterales bacterium]
MYLRCLRNLHSYRLLSAGLCLLAFSACQREKRELRPSPTRLVVFSDAARQSDIQPGGRQSQPVVANPSHGSAYEISEGARLYDWYNCSGCHAGGGGGMGPPLIKTDWIYGGEPANIFDTIVKGRPNGMPAWGNRIPEYQVWQLVSYVRSLNNLEPTSATPARTDTIQQDTAGLRPRPTGVASSGVTK